jgi:hypothetical protein
MHSPDPNLCNNTGLTGVALFFLVRAPCINIPSPSHVLVNCGVFLIVYFITILLSKNMHLLILNPYLKFSLLSSLTRLENFMPVYFLKLISFLHADTNPSIGLRNTFCHFTCVSAHEISQLITQSADTFCGIDFFSQYCLSIFTYFD